MRSPPFIHGAALQQGMESYCHCFEVLPVFREVMHVCPDVCRKKEEKEIFLLLPADGRQLDKTCVKEISYKKIMLVKGRLLNMNRKYRIDTAENRQFLKEMREQLLAFGRRFPSPGGSSWYLGDDGTPWISLNRETWITSRMAHVYSIGFMLASGIVSREICGGLADDALRGLRGELHDTKNGGWYAGLTQDGQIVPNKQCYAHAFVILAACSGLLAGREGAEELLEEALRTFDRFFWNEKEGLCRDTWDTEFCVLDDYRGLNANMHTVEAFLAVADSVGKEEYRARAGRIIDQVIGWAGENDWRIPEHFTSGWKADLECNKDIPDDRFKPYGATPGHGIEWARLITQWALSTYKGAGMEEKSRMSVRKSGEGIKNICAETKERGEENETSVKEVCAGVKEAVTGMMETAGDKNSKSDAENREADAGESTAKQKEISVKAAQYIEAAEQLYNRAVSDAWNADGAPGIVYTTDWEGNPVIHDRMHWTLAEAINTSAVLYRVTGKEKYAGDYAEFMKYLDEKVLDPVNGSWYHQLDRNNHLLNTVWPGKSDLYHAFQATLIPYHDVDVSIAAAVKRDFIFQIGV